MIEINTNNRTLKFTKHNEPSLFPDKHVTQYVMTYRRPKAKWGAKKKAVAAAAITVLIWIGYNVLVMTDVHDTEPTITFVGRP